MIENFIHYIGMKSDIDDTKFEKTFLNLNYDNKKHNDKTKLFILMNAAICFLVDSKPPNNLKFKEIGFSEEIIDNIKTQIKKNYKTPIEIPYLRYCYFYVIFHKYKKNKCRGIKQKNQLSIKLEEIKDDFLKKCCFVYYILNNDIYI